MTASAWRRLAPAAGDGTGPGGPGLAELLAGLEAYLDEPGTIAALDAAEDSGAYPRAVLTGLRERGLAELLVPDRATSPVVGALNVLTAARSGSLAITVGVNVLALLPVLLGGDDELCALVTRRLRAGQAFALLLTELPHGSNLLRTDAAATPDGDGYRLTGEKHLINGGTEHEMLVALLRTRRSPAGRPMAATRDLSLFLVDRGPDTVALPRWSTLPVRAADISGVRFAGTRVPANRLIGPEGGGFPLIQKTLKLSHAGIAALASGAVSGALALTLARARTRDVYGRPIVTLGAIAEHCARMAALDVVVAATAVKAARLAGRIGPAAGYFSAVAKFACCRLAEAAVDEGRRVHGAQALLAGSRYARFVRDVPLYGVFDGTSHVLLEDLSWFVPRVTATPAGDDAHDDLLVSAYRAAPRTIRDSAGGSARSVAPPLRRRCDALAGLTGDPAAARLSELAGRLGDAVRDARATGAWAAEQPVRFAAAALLAELEALLATLELTLDEARDRFGLPGVAAADRDAARYAVVWRGDRIAARLDRLAPAGDPWRDEARRGLLAFAAGP